MSQENVEIVRTIYDEAAQGRYWTCGHLFDPDIEYARKSAYGDVRAGTWRGLAEMSAAIAEYLDAFQQVRTEGERYIDAGDSVGVFTRAKGIGKASGLPIEEEFGEVLTLRDGRIIRYHAYRHRAEALEAVGLRD